MPDGFPLKIFTLTCLWCLINGGKLSLAIKINATVSKIDRRFFEICVFSQMMLELKSGDLCILGSDQFELITVKSLYLMRGINSTFLSMRNSLEYLLMGLGLLIN